MEFRWKCAAVEGLFDSLESEDVLPEQFAPSDGIPDLPPSNRSEKH
jgi:hypothetical protein